MYKTLHPGLCSTKNDKWIHRNRFWEQALRHTYASKYLGCSHIGTFRNCFRFRPYSWFLQWNFNENIRMNQQHTEFTNTVSINQMKTENVVQREKKMRKREWLRLDMIKNKPGTYEAKKLKLANSNGKKEKK